MSKENYGNKSRASFHDAAKKAEDILELPGHGTCTSSMQSVPKHPTRQAQKNGIQGHG